MKKALIVLLLLAVAGGLFAQGFTFTGYVDSGITVFIPDADRGDGTVFARTTARDAEVNDYRGQIQGAYVNADQNAGLNIRFRVDGGTFNNHYAYGWVKALDGMIEVLGGKIDNGYFNSGGGILDGDQGEGVGILAVAKPIGDMLTLGFGTYGNTTVKKLDQLKYTFNAKVLVPDLVQVTATFRNPNALAGYITGPAPEGAAGWEKSDKPFTDTDGDGTADYDWNNDGNIDAADLAFTYTPKAGVEGWEPKRATAWNIQNDNDARGILGIKILAVPNLTAVVEAEVRNIDQFSDLGLLNLYETVGYKLNDLQVTLNAAQYLGLADTFGDADEVPGLRFWLWATYALNEGKIVPRLDVNYFKAGAWDYNATTGKANYNVHYKNFTVTYQDEFATFTVRPSVQFKADANSWFEIGYQATATLDSANDKNYIDHAIISGVKVSF